MLVRTPAKLASLALLALVLAWPGVSAAGEPRLDEIAGARGIAPGQLDVAQRRSSSVRPSAPAELRTLSLHGVPLRGAFETIWRPGELHERVVASRYPVAPPQRLPSEARLTLDDARAQVITELRADQQVDPSRIRGELVYLLVLEHPVLAWELTTPFSLAAPEPSYERIWISAITGRELERTSLLFSLNQSEVFRHNPSSTPEPIQVTLGNLDPSMTWSEELDPEQVYLNGARLRSFNCIDAEAGPYAPWWAEGECYPTQTITADAQGDFFVELPDVGIVAENVDPTDLYAELSMYYHAETFFEFMAAKGIEGFPCEMSNMVANFHYLEPSPGYPDLEFGPLNNAYYSGSCELEDGPTMLFGQGSGVDFGFDGDVVYHELGHGMVQQLTPDGLQLAARRPEALLRDARGINEAIADYHTIMITQEPGMADYVGRYWAEYDAASIRDAENEKQCPRDMAGQEHNDGEPFTAALWAARRRIGGDKLDTVVLAALGLMPSDVSLELASAALLEVAAGEVEVGTWTSEDYDELERTLAGRNLLDCLRVTEGSQPALDPDGRFMVLRGRTAAVTPFWPGPLQLRHTVPSGSDNVVISFTAKGQGNSTGQPVADTIDPRVLIKRGGEPIEFAYALGGVGSATDEDDSVSEVTIVSGDWEMEYVPSKVTTERREVIVRGLEPGEVVHLAFINRDKTNAVLRDMVVGSIPADDLDGGSPSVDDDDLAVETGLDDGCACASGAGDAKSSLALGLLVLAGLRRRRQPRAPLNP